MTRFLTLVTVLLSLVIFGCEQSKETESTSGSTESATEKMAGAAKTVAEEAKGTAEVVAEKATEAAKEVMVETKEATTAAADTVAEKAKTATLATTMAAKEAVEAVQQSVSPETIVIKASYGAITFPHAMHSGAYDCATCHGEEPPGLFGLNKDKAHLLCIDCHKKEGAGPTVCSGCHKK